MGGLERRDADKERMIRQRRRVRVMIRVVMKVEVWVGKKTKTI
jgi:hypothetical protein